MRFFLSLPLLVLLSVLSANESFGQFADFRDVDKVVSANMSTFKEIFQEGYKRTVKISLFGDSQETVPHAAGEVYIPALNLELNRRYGNTPVSSLAMPNSYRTRWLLRGAQHGVVESFGRNNSSVLLPSQSIARFINFPRVGGLLAQLNLDASNSPRSDDVDVVEFDTRRVRVQVVIRDSIGSGEVQWRINVQDGDVTNFFGGTDIATGVTDLGLGSTTDFVTADLGVFEIPEGHNAVQAIARGVDGNGVEIAGIRFLNESSPVGVAVDSFSAGGYRANRLVNVHGDADDAFRAIANNDIIALHFGANDLIDRTAVEYRSDLIEVIEQYRDWSGDDKKPFILFTDADRQVDNAHDREQFDQFADVAAGIAMSMENVLAVNSRLLAHEIGWHIGGDFTRYVADTVHYNTEGSRVLARLEIDALFEALDIAPAAVYLNGSQFADNFRDQVNGSTDNDASFGYRLTSANQNQTVPYVNVDEIVVDFVPEVDVDSLDVSDFVLTGDLGFSVLPTAIPTITAVNVDANDPTAVRLALSGPLDTAAFELQINGSNITFNGIAGLDSSKQFTVLPGDTDDDGQVLFFDILGSFPLIGSSLSDASYSFRSDLTGDGHILIFDLFQAFGRVGNFVEE